jgi:non-canonical purine NTP pyrophosphatase (RdgB/HAM1 family)/nicotinate (nicotinamide) nucleotide adenylyltransferase
MDGLTPRRVGVMGGTFDPVHIGHLMAAEEAIWALALDRVIFAPAGVPPHKPGATPADAGHRMAMIELAIAGDDRMALSRVDIDRPGPHFTVDMLALLRREGAVPAGAGLWFIMGADSLVDLPTWRDPSGIIRLARLAVVRRPGFAPDLGEVARAVPGVADSVDLVEMPLVGVSGTDIRLRVGEGRPIRHQVPRSVEAYIGAQALYRPEREPTVVLATENAHKAREIEAILAGLGVGVAPVEAGRVPAVAETGATLEENARLKAAAYAAALGRPALADDSGLEVDALDGFPGVVSSRWLPGSDADRVAGLLERLAGVPAERRTARFRTVAALAWPDGRLVTAEGRVEGRIAAIPRGAFGFGYDPVFLVFDGGHQGEVTMAELPSEEKNRLSHRYRAILALVSALEERSPGP